MPHPFNMSTPATGPTSTPQDPGEAVLRCMEAWGLSTFWSRIAASICLVFITGSLGACSDTSGHQDRHGRSVPDQTAYLLRQCPPNPRVPVNQEAKLPVEVAQAGKYGPNILVIHGGEQALSAIGGGPGNFAKQMILGEHGWRVAVPARPGFGGSPSRGRDDQVADLRWIVPMLRENGSSHLWGHSFGGAEALLAAAAAPDSVRSLVLVEPALWWLEDALPGMRRSAPVEREREERQEMLLSATTPEEYAAGFLGDFQPKTSGLKVWLTRTLLRLRPGLSKRVGCGILQARNASGAEFLRAADIVRRAEIPVLVITGGWSPSRDRLGGVVAGVLDGRHVIVPSKDHIVMSDNPDGFNRAVTGFMRAADRAWPHRVAREGDPSAFADAAIVADRAEQVR